MPLETIPEAKEIIPMQEKNLQPVTDPFIQMIAAAARDNDTDVTKLNALYDLMQRRDNDHARAAFNAAISDAKGEIGPVLKNRTVDFTSQKGRTHYRHEDFAEVARTVDPALARHGLSYRFRAKQLPAGGDRPGRLEITCILAHSQGHSEETTLEAPEDHTGNKNPIQAVGSAATYLQRQTLKLALGLAASEDDDGRASGQPAAESLVSTEEWTALDTAMKDTNTGWPALAEFLQVETQDQINRTHFTIAMSMLKQKAARAQKKATEKPA